MRKRIAAVAFVFALAIVPGAAFANHDNGEHNGHANGHKRNSQKQQQEQTQTQKQQQTQTQCLICISILSPPPVSL